MEFTIWSEWTLKTDDNFMSQAESEMAAQTVLDAADDAAEMAGATVCDHSIEIEQDSE